MAEVIRNVGKVFRISSSVAGEGVGTCILGDASDGCVGTIAVHIVPGAGAGFSLTVKGRARNREAAQPVTPMPATPVPFQPIPFLSLNAANAAISPPAWSLAAIAGGGIIMIPATGLSIALDVTAATAGEAWVYWTPCEGHAAVP